MWRTKIALIWFDCDESSSSSGASFGLAVTGDNVGVVELQFLGIRPDSDAETDRYHLKDADDQPTGTYMIRCTEPGRYFGSNKFNIIGGPFVEKFRGLFL